MSDVWSPDVATFWDQKSWRKDLFGDLPKDPVTELTLVAFDDYIIGDSLINTTTTIASNQLLNAVIGAFDQMAIQVVVDDVDGSSSVYLETKIEHSGDGISWIAKAATAEIPLMLLTSGDTNNLPLAYDDGSVPSLAFVRIRLGPFSTQPFRMHVKVTLTLNNVDELGFTRKIDEWLEKYVVGGCNLTLKSGDMIVITNFGGHKTIEGLRWHARPGAQEYPWYWYDRHEFRHIGTYLDLGGDLSKFFDIVQATHGEHWGETQQVWRVKAGYLICFKRHTMAVFDESHGKLLFHVDNYL